MSDGANREAKKEGLKEWFFSHYEDPVHNTPYESAEGGYIYIWGGPYEALDVLWGEFGDKVDEDIIQEVAKELDLECLEWTRIPTLDDIDPPAPLSEHFARFIISVDRIKDRVGSIQMEAADPFLASLLYAHTITCLEAYLADAFLACLKKEKFFRAFIESDPQMKQEKIPVAEIYKKMASLERDATRRLQGIVFHNLPVVQQMYRETLSIEFPPGLKDLLKAVAKRHDIVHRNCKDKQGTEFTVTKAEVLALVVLVERFVTELDKLVEKGLA
jgi:hypothetical protein